MIIRQETEKKETIKSKMQRCNERKQRRKGATKEDVATTERKICKCPNLETSESDRTRKKERTTERQKDRRKERKIHDCLGNPTKYAPATEKMAPDDHKTTCLG